MSTVNSIGNYGHQSVRSLDQSHGYSNLTGSTVMTPAARQLPPPPQPSYPTHIDRGSSVTYTTGLPNQGQYSAVQPAAIYRTSFQETPRPQTGGPVFTSSNINNPVIDNAPSQNLFAVESRLRQLENSIRTVEIIHTNHNNMQTSIQYLEMQVRALTGQVQTLMDRDPGPALRFGFRHEEPELGPEINERVWDAYRSYQAPLTPWLIVLSSASGLSGSVVSTLGSRVHSEPDQSNLRSGELTRSQIAQAVASGRDWSREQIQALGTFATWEGNGSFASFVIGQTRSIVGKFATDLKGSMQEAREIVELVLLEHMLWSIHSPEYVPTSAKTSFAAAWRDRVRLNIPSVPSEKDHDVKLLAWLEYAEMLTDAQNGLFETTDGSYYTRRDSGSSVSGQPEDMDRQTVDLIDRRQPYLAGWEAWNSRWGGADDPILTLHYHYAILLSTTPLLMPMANTTALSQSRPNVAQTSPQSAQDSTMSRPPIANSDRWEEMLSDQRGYNMLSRSKDAAIALIRSICSPEVSRTLHYSMPLFRSRLALAITHLLVHSVALPHSTLTALPMHQSTLRLAWERLNGGLDVAQPSLEVNWTGIGQGSILSEVIQTGDLTSGTTRGLMRELQEGTIKPGQALWDRVLGVQ